MLNTINHLFNNRSMLKTSLLIAFVMIWYSVFISAQEWEIDVLDNGKQFSSMTQRSLCFDADNHPHMAYGRDWLYYMRHDGMRWHYEVVDKSYGVGTYASLALDTMGYPHISYRDASNDDLKYAYKDGAGWHTATIDSQGSAGMYSSIALDTGNQPHISYHEDEIDDLKYAYRDGAGWHVETVDSEGSVGYRSSLAMDDNGYPHISYYDGNPNCDLKYAYKNEFGWHFEVVDSEGNVGTYTSITVDSANYPHIGYYSSTGADLKYAFRDMGGWHIYTVDSEGGIGWYPSIVLDDAELPHISYTKWTTVGGVCGQYYYVPDDVKYAYKDAVGWHVQTVDWDGYTGNHTSITLDSVGSENRLLG